jgi:hypothetical protein
MRSLERGWRQSPSKLPCLLIRNVEEEGRASTTSGAERCPCGCRSRSLRASMPWRVQTSPTLAAGRGAARRPESLTAQCAVNLGPTSACGCSGSPPKSWLSRHSPGTACQGTGGRQSVHQRRQLPATVALRFFGPRPPSGQGSSDETLNHPWSRSGCILQVVHVAN